MRNSFLDSPSGSIRAAATTGKPASVRASLPVKQTSLVPESLPLPQNFAHGEETSCPMGGSIGADLSKYGSRNSPSLFRCSPDGCATGGRSLAFAQSAGGNGRGVAAPAKLIALLFRLRPFFKLPIRPRVASDSATHPLAQPETNPAVIQ